MNKIKFSFKIGEELKLASQIGKNLALAKVNKKNAEQFIQLYSKSYENEKYKKLWINQANKEFEQHNKELKEKELQKSLMGTF